MVTIPVDLKVSNPKSSSTYRRSNLRPPLPLPRSNPSSRSNPRSNPSSICSKVFVGGIAWKSEEASLSRFFSRVGLIADIAIFKHRSYGLSKEFGFVAFSEPAAAMRATTNASPFIDGRRVSCNLASLRSRRSASTALACYRCRGLHHFAETCKFAIRCFRCGFFSQTKANCCIDAQMPVSDPPVFTVNSSEIEVIFLSLDRSSADSKDVDQLDMMLWDPGLGCCYEKGEVEGLSSPVSPSSAVGIRKKCIGNVGRRRLCRTEHPPTSNLGSQPFVDISIVVSLKGLAVSVAFSRMRLLVVLESGLMAVGSMFCIEARGGNRSLIVGRSNALISGVKVGMCSA